MIKAKGQISARLLIAAAIGVSVVLTIGLLLYHFLRPSVDVTEVIDGPVVEAFYATGTVSAAHEYSVRSNDDGILHLHVDKGSVVKRGQLLAEVDNAKLRFDVEQAKAELHRQQQLADDATSPMLSELRAKLQASMEQLAIAQNDEKRVTALLDRGATSQTELDTSMNRVKSLWSDVESLKSQIAARKIDLQRDVDVASAALASAQWEVDQTIIKSPIDGAVLDWPVSNGTRVAINDHVLELADVTPTHLVMRAQVDEEDKNRLRPPTPDNQQQVEMTLYAYPNEVLSGKVERIYDKADPDRRTYEVDVTFDRPDLRLAVGMTGELNFIVAQKPSAKIVPTQAVQGGAVMVVRNGRLEKPDIVTGLRSIERTEIRSGLELGDVVVISPTIDLEPGQNVRVHRVDPLSAAMINAPKATSDSFKGFGG